MLNDQGIQYRYREYTQEPLSATELKKILKQLGLKAGQILRKRDAANRELGLTGKEPEATLIKAMAAHPTLIERPIGVLGGRAALGRPVENLLKLTGK